VSGPAGDGPAAPPGRPGREERFLELLPAARAVAMRLSPAAEGSVAREDLLQAAALGLWRALDRYDPDRGTAPLTFCLPFMMGEARRALAGALDAGGRRGLLDSLRRAEAARRAFVSAVGREPTVGEVADVAGLDRRRLAEALAGARRLPLAEEPAAGPELDPVGERAADRTDLARALAGLEEGERRVVALRHLAGLTQTETARQLGLSQSTVHRLERRALRRLAAELASAGPKRSAAPTALTR
jgi:RNA polymerase sigma factor (sigma-70 family)